MIDPTSSETTAIAEFYDSLAPDYDTMTGFEKRFAAERPHIHFLVERYEIRQAVDAGCGTGFLSLLLAQLGVVVTALDISSAMVDRVRAHAAALNLTVHSVKARFDQIPSFLTKPTDAVFCLGNSLPHLADSAELAATLSAFRAALRPGGVGVFQILNYERILAGQATIQHMREAGDKTFTRVYAYHESTIDFSIRVFDRSRESESVRTITLRPLLPTALTSALADAGFVDIHLFGSMALQPFDPVVSRDAVVIAVAPSL